ncbi:MAG: mycothiol transferase [Acidimicrobiales bacterium]
MDDIGPARTLLADAFSRIHEQVASVTDGLGPDALRYRADPDANTIAWLVWHLTRAQDAQVADLADEDSVWRSDGWVDRFDLSLAPDATGYGASTDEVGALDGATTELLTGYHEATNLRTVAYLDRLTADELARVVDDSHDPPVTVAIRLVSVIGDCLAHLGQAAYVKGLADRAADGGARYAAVQEEGR